MTALLAGCAAPRAGDLTTATLAEAMAQRPIVLLGEVHDNEAQHAVRAAALRRLLEQGARPALAFEQFDRERQSDLDRARNQSLPPGQRSRTDHLIAEAGAARGWNWKLYRPYLQLAIDYELPIVAANLSRAGARRASQQGFAAVFDSTVLVANGLDRLPAAFLRGHEQAVDAGHCKLTPAAMLPALARAQIARDVALARAIRPHFDRGVVLFAGNGHARNDIGVPFFLTAEERERTVTIGLIESADSTNIEAAPYDVALRTPAQTRKDPCVELRERLRPSGLRPPATQPR